MAAIVERLCGEDDCHTIILYGSRARGDATAESDYDVIGFRDRGASVVRQTGWLDGVLLDVFIYPSSRVHAPDASLLQLRGGVVLCERDGAGAKFLAELDAVHARGPDALPPGQREAQRAWAWKMLDRAARGDVEGDYRRHWLLTALLENCFLARGVWYPGSKAALQTLEAEDPQLYCLFAAALEPGASLEAIKGLVQATSGDRDPKAAPPGPRRS